MRHFLSIGALAACLFASAASAQTPWPGLAGTWCWGSKWRSFQTPFLLVAHRNNRWVIETKNYMHAYFMGGVKDVRIEERHLSFTYWYAPRRKWAHCRFVAAADTMSGICDGETRVGGWGPMASYIWREAPLRAETLNE